MTTDIDSIVSYEKLHLHWRQCFSITPPPRLTDTDFFVTAFAVRWLNVLRTQGQKFCRSDFRTNVGTRTETIMHTVLKFQVDYAGFHGGLTD